MKVEFLGTYKGHEVKQTKANKDYIELNCLENLSNKSQKIFIFNDNLKEQLKNFKDGEEISVIFETWFSKKTQKQVLIVKDIVAC